MSSVVRTYGFVDLAGFTALTETHGDRPALTMLERFEALTRESLPRGGLLVKSIGDAVMLTFDDPSAAVDAVVSLFGAIADTDLPVARGGLHHGPAIERDGDYFGASVNLAARLAGHARGGQVVVTSAVAAAARRAGVEVTALGLVDLRNVPAPVELFQLRFGTDAGGGPAVDPVCRMQVSRSSAPVRLWYRDYEYSFCSLRCAGIFTNHPGSGFPGTA